MMECRSKQSDATLAEFASVVRFREKAWTYSQAKALNREGREDNTSFPPLPQRTRQGWHPHRIRCDLLSDLNFLLQNSAGHGIFRHLLRKDARFGVRQLQIAERATVAYIRRQLLQGVPA